MVWFVRNGYVQAFLGGNAVAVHDLEAAIFGTTLGMTSSGQGVEGGHALHMRAINQIRRAGGIAAAVRQGVVTSDRKSTRLNSSHGYISYAVFCLKKKKKKKRTRH